jgi:hypothetical protein
VIRRSALSGVSAAVPPCIAPAPPPEDVVDVFHVFRYRYIGPI